LCTWKTYRPPDAVRKPVKVGTPENEMLGCPLLSTLTADGAMPLMHNLGGSLLLNPRSVHAHCPGANPDDAGVELGVKSIVKALSAYPTFSAQDHDIFPDLQVSGKLSARAG
jgi:hypothetical protein